MSTETDTFSKYGAYTITNSFELTLPNTEIRIKRIGENVFSYIRKNSKDEITEKIIPSKSNEY